MVALFNLKKKKKKKEHKRIQKTTKSLPASNNPSYRMVEGPGIVGPFQPWQQECQVDAVYRGYFQLHKFSHMLQNCIAVSAQQDCNSSEDSSSY